MTCRDQWTGDLPRSGRTRHGLQSLMALLPAVCEDVETVCDSVLSVGALSS